MKCLILAAGYATRLYPLTENFPKPLLEEADTGLADRRSEKRSRRVYRRDEPQVRR